MRDLSLLSSSLTRPSKYCVRPSIAASRCMPSLNIAATVLTWFRVSQTETLGVLNKFSADRIKRQANKLHDVTKSARFAVVTKLTSRLRQLVYDIYWSKQSDVIRQDTTPWNGAVQRRCLAVIGTDGVPRRVPKGSPSVVAIFPAEPADREKATTKYLRFIRN